MVQIVFLHERDYDKLSAVGNSKLSIVDASSARIVVKL